VKEHKISGWPIQNVMWRTYRCIFNILLMMSETKDVSTCVSTYRVYLKVEVIWFMVEANLYISGNKANLSEFLNTKPNNCGVSSSLQGEACTWLSDSFKALWVSWLGQIKLGWAEIPYYIKTIGIFTLISLVKLN
jgi:hypothetical protein